MALNICKVRCGVECLNAVTGRCSAAVRGSPQRHGRSAWSPPI